MKLSRWKRKGGESREVERENYDDSQPLPWLLLSSAAPACDLSLGCNQEDIQVYKTVLLPNLDPSVSRLLMFFILCFLLKPLLHSLSLSPYHNWKRINELLVYLTKLHYTIDGLAEKLPCNHVGYMSEKSLQSSVIHVGGLQQPVVHLGSWSSEVKGTPQTFVLPLHLEAHSLQP